MHEAFFQNDSLCEQLKQQNEVLQRENEELKRRLIATNGEDSFSEPDPKKANCK
jgi:hypothetical protein